MFERFTPDARQIVMGAQREAVELRHSIFGTEHLLLAMLDNPGTAGEVLHEAGLEAEAVRSEIVRLVGAVEPLLSEEDAEALRTVGIDADAVLARIQESFGAQALLPPAKARRGWFGRRHQRATFSPRARKVLELSLREAIRLQNKEIRSGHILLGLIRENGGLAAQIIAEAGVDADALKTRTEALLQKAA
jgi:ATP-dependent Clp protease ATP-binding subunit ClpA